MSKKKSQKEDNKQTTLPFGKTQKKVVFASEDKENKENKENKEDKEDKEDKEEPVQENGNDDRIQILPSDIHRMDKEALIQSIEKVSNAINQLETDLGEDAWDEETDEDDFDLEALSIPEHCIPIRVDIRRMNWNALAKEVQFDVITMDPPWQLASATPTRGVAIGYKQLPNRDIMDIPIPKLQKNGFLFIWVINARYTFALKLFEEWGYKYAVITPVLTNCRLVDDIAWVKSTVNRRLAKGHGYYLQHAKESCLVGKKGEDPPGTCFNILSDVIFAERRGQSQKPEEIYELIENLVPNGKYLEIFARRNNLRNYWVSIGNEL